MNKLITKKEDLSILDSIEFKEDTHTYKLQNAKLFSVTQIMENLNANTYNGIDQSVMQTAANRGSNVHYACEMYDLYGICECKPEHINYFNAYKDFKKEHEVKTIANEVRLYHKTLQYAGTLDLISIVDNKVTLIDIKTTAVLHTKLVAVQLAAYLDALNSYGLTVEQVATLQLKKDGTYDYEIVEPDLKTFRACMRIKAWELMK